MTIQNIIQDPGRVFQLNVSGPGRDESVYDFDLSYWNPNSKIILEFDANNFTSQSQTQTVYGDTTSGVVSGSQPVANQNFIIEVVDQSLLGLSQVGFFAPAFTGGNQLFIQNGISNGHNIIDLTDILQQKYSGGIIGGYNRGIRKFSLRMGLDLPSGVGGSGYANITNIVVHTDMSIQYSPPSITLPPVSITPPTPILVPFTIFQPGQPPIDILTTDPLSAASTVQASISAGNVITPQNISSLLPSLSPIITPVSNNNTKKFTLIAQNGSTNIFVLTPDDYLKLLGLLTAGESTALVTDIQSSNPNSLLDCTNFLDSNLKIVNPTPISNTSSNPTVKPTGQKQPNVLPFIIAGGVGLALIGVILSKRKK